MRLIQFTAVSLALGAAVTTAAVAGQLKRAPYPTQTKVEYVLQCMEVNGKSPEMLQKCSCGIDTIEAELPFDTYEMADTGLQLAGVPGNRAAAMRSVNTVKDAIEALHKAQADSNLKCF
jgi:hypothetical protein